METALANIWLFVAALSDLAGDPVTYLYLILSVLLGIVFGALPGLTATLAVTILTGFFSNKFPVEQSLIALIGAYVGAIYGGSYPSILLNIPGTAAAAATAMDGHPIARRGEGGRALGLTTVASFIGTMVGAACLLLLVWLLLLLARQIASPEKALLALFGILVSGTLMSRDLVLKGWISGLVGLAMAMVGLDPILSQDRFTFGWSYLLSGFQVVPVLMGAFAIPQILDGLRAGPFAGALPQVGRILPSLGELRRYGPTVARSGAIGVGVGALPGVGEDVAGWVSYGVGKNTSRDPGSFGTGSFEGLLSSETANNACVGGALIPLLVLGIPGSPPAAALMGALMINNVTPGPTIDPALVMRIVAIMVMASVTMLALGLVMARLFGAGAAADAFVVAFRIPNFLRRLFAEGAFSLAFVPVMAEYRDRGDHAALRDLLDNVAGALLAVLLAVTGVGVLAAYWVVAIFAPGYLDEPGKWSMAADMLRIMFPYLLTVSLTALAAGILNTLGRFGLPALTPALLNLSMITAALGFSRYFEVPIHAMAWGVFVAGFLQLAMLVPALARHGVLPRPRWGFGHPGVKRILKLMVPTLFGASVAQINLLVDTLIASLLATGSIAWLWYADRMMEFPLGVFGVALSTVILPTLATLHARSARLDFRRTLDWALLLGWLIGLPAAAGLAVLALPIITTLFQYGAMETGDARMSAWALMAYAAGLPAFIGVKVFQPGFFSRQDTATPVKVAVIALLSNVVLNIAAVSALLVTLAGGWPETGLLAGLAAHPGIHVGLALASSLAGYVNAGLLWRYLRAEGLAPRLPGRRILQGAFAAFAMVVFLLWFQPAAGDWLDFDALHRGAWLAACIVAGASVYGIVLLAVGLRPGMLAKPEGG